MGVVEQLGVFHLWVDALCIVQDHIESKHNQIHAMAGVYANSYVTIIAGNGWDANHGLRGIQGVTPPRHLSEFLKHDVQENLQPYSSIWYSRGWTFQEMIFAPRKIMFQYQLAIWECCESTWHESSLSKAKSPLSAASCDLSVNPWQAINANPRQRPGIRFAQWPDVEQYVLLVQEYAVRKLTFAEDGLLAISSLLSVMTASFPGGFISGLPVMFFHQALLWQPKEPMQRRQNTNSSKPLPSWSWVGWEGRLMVDEWLRHWDHLSIQYDEVGEYIPKRKLVRVKPTVMWYYGNEVTDRNPIHVPGPPEAEFDRRTPFDDFHLPVGKYQKGAHFFNHLVNNVNYHSVPPSSNDSMVSISPAYLFCSTKRAWFNGYFSTARSQIMLVRGTLTAFGNIVRIGSIKVEYDSKSIANPPVAGYEVAVISSGEMVSTVSDDLWLWGNLDGDKYEHMDDRDQHWYHGSQTDSEAIKEFYYVLLIEWKDGIAYREGLGRVDKEAFDARAEDVDLILG